MPSLKYGYCLICHPQNMDVVSGAASVAQLVNYSHGAVRQLVHLYKAAQEGSSFCRTQRSNIGFLLESIQRICTEEAPDTDSILPLLIATAGLATSLLILLKPKGTWGSGWHWISKGHEIESAFSALNDKTRLLQLHITEKTYSVVARVQKDIKLMNQSLDSRPSQLDQPVCANPPFSKKWTLFILAHISLFLSRLLAPRLRRHDRHDLELGRRVRATDEWTGAREDHLEREQDQEEGSAVRRHGLGQGIPLGGNHGQREQGGRRIPTVGRECGGRAHGVHSGAARRGRDGPKRVKT